MWVAHDGPHGRWLENERLARSTGRRYALNYRPTEGDERVANHRPGDARPTEPLHEYPIPGQDVANILVVGKGALVRGGV